MIPTDLQGALRINDVVELMKTMPSELSYSVSCLLEQWRHLATQTKVIDRQLRIRSKVDPLIALYRRVPGIGPLTAHLLCSELGDMSDFKNERALFSYTGLTPGEYSSGEKVYRGHISRQGSAHLRHLLTEAGWKIIPYTRGGVSCNNYKVAVADNVNLHNSSN